jgi:hypothetical protein
VGWRVGLVCGGGAGGVGGLGVELALPIGQSLHQFLC